MAGKAAPFSCTLVFVPGDHDLDRTEIPPGLLGVTASERAIGSILDRTQAHAPTYLVLSGWNSPAKLFRFADNCKKPGFSAGNPLTM